jgi:hypothetical protein
MSPFSILRHDGRLQPEESLLRSGAFMRVAEQLRIPASNPPPGGIHERTPVILGSALEVDHVLRHLQA